MNIVMNDRKVETLRKYLVKPHEHKKWFEPIVSTDRHKLLHV